MFRGVLFLFVLAFIFPLPSVAQDIGLLSDKKAYISLNFNGKIGESQRLDGHASVYDLQRGFVHSKIEGQLSGNKLKLSGKNPQKFKSLKSEYARTKIRSNTAWVESGDCPECARTLLGTTLKKEDAAVKLLSLYSKNTERFSSSVLEYIAFSRAVGTLCALDVLSRCTVDDDVGILVEQSQTGAVQVVAAALGKRTSVATFSTPQIDGALILSPKEVLSRVLQHTGPSLDDGVIDFSNWQVVSNASQSIRGLNLLNLRILSDGGFFSKMADTPRAVSELNGEMSELFSFIAKRNQACSYGDENSNGFFLCFIHTSELGIVGDGAWLKAFAVMTPYRLAGSMEVAVHIYFERHFGSAEAMPTGEFIDIDYDNADEARMAQLATLRVARSFQKFFDPNIIVRRR